MRQCVSQLCLHHFNLSNTSKIYCIKTIANDSVSHGKLSILQFFTRLEVDSIAVVVVVIYIDCEGFVVAYLKSFSLIIHGFIVSDFLAQLQVQGQYIIMH